MKATQHTMQDPRYQYEQPNIPAEQTQPEPGLDKDLIPEADHGEFSYVGSEKLKGRKALITGGDSGIGRAVAIAYAKEGADVAIIHLPEEAPDAEKTLSIIDEIGGKSLAIAGDIKDESFCRDAVMQVGDSFGGLDILVNNAGKQVYIDDQVRLAPNNSNTPSKPMFTPRFGSHKQRLSIFLRAHQLLIQLRSSRISHHLDSLTTRQRKVQLPHLQKVRPKC